MFSSECVLPNYWFRFEVECNLTIVINTKWERRRINCAFLILCHCFHSTWKVFFSFVSRLSQSLCLVFTLYFSLLLFCCLFFRLRSPDIADVATFRAKSEQKKTVEKSKVKWRFVLVKIEWIATLFPCSTHRFTINWFIIHSFLCCAVGSKVYLLCNQKCCNLVQNAHDKA